MKNIKFDTKVIHSGLETDPTTGSIITPIYQTSTYVQSNVSNRFKDSNG